MQPEVYNIIGNIIMINTTIITRSSSDVIHRFFGFGGSAGLFFVFFQDNSRIFTKEMNCMFLSNSWKISFRVFILGDFCI